MNTLFVLNILSLHEVKITKNDIQTEELPSCMSFYQTFLELKENSGDKNDKYRNRC